MKRNTQTPCSVNETQLLGKESGPGILSPYNTADTQGSSIKVVQEISLDSLR